MKIRIRSRLAGGSRYNGVRVDESEVRADERGAR
jgi:hypothetical protein